MLLTKDEIADNWKTLEPVALSIRDEYKSAPDEMKRLYTAHGNLSLLFSYAYYVGVVKKYADPNSTVLDWGGLYGQVSCMLEKYFPGKTVCYLPEMDDLINFWHRKFGVNNVAVSNKGESVAKINAKEGEIGVVVSSGVLEHTYEYGIDDVDALKEIYRVLSPKGVLIIWHLPTQYAATDLINKMFGRYYHLKRYTRDEISWKLSISGFELVEIESHDILMPKIRLLLGKMLGEKVAFYIDYIISGIPIVSLFAQQLTVIARKKPGFIFDPCYDGKVS